MVVTALVLMLAHTAEILIWSLGYTAVGAAPAGSDLLDFAFVNYTTLGYGDVTPLPEWRLIGPMTAMNGILMFGFRRQSCSKCFERPSRMSHSPDAAPNSAGPVRPIAAD